MIKKSSRVTVVIASFNHESYIEECLVSVFEQAGVDFNVIVCDDASSDGSQAEIERVLRVRDWSAARVFHNENSGVCATFNEALALVRTEYVVFLAADDFMLPGRLIRQVELLDLAGPACAMAHSSMQFVDANSVLTGVSDELSDGGSNHDGAAVEGVALDLLRSGNWIAAPSAMSRTSALREVGGYDEDLWYEDYDMWIRLSRRFRFAYDPARLVAYRLLQTSMSLKPENAMKFELNLIKIYRKHLDLDDKLDGYLTRRCYEIALAAYKIGQLPRAAVLEAILPHVRRTKRVGAVHRLLVVAFGLPVKFLRA